MLRARWACYRYRSAACRYAPGRCAPALHAASSTPHSLALADASRSWWVRCTALGWLLCRVAPWVSATLAVHNTLLSHCSAPCSLCLCGAVRGTAYTAAHVAALRVATLRVCDAIRSVDAVSSFVLRTRRAQALRVCDALQA